MTRRLRLRRHLLRCRVIRISQTLIKTGVFEERLSHIISVLFDTRTDSDYDDFFVISKAEVVEQTENAEYFLQKIRVFLGEK